MVGQGWGGELTLFIPIKMEILLLNVSCLTVSNVAIAVFKYLKVGAGLALFSPKSRMRRNGRGVQKGRFRPQEKKNFQTVGTVQKVKWAASGGSSLLPRGGLQVKTGWPLAGDSVKGFLIQVWVGPDGPWGPFWLWKFWDFVNFICDSTSSSFTTGPAALYGVWGLFLCFHGRDLLLLYYYQSCFHFAQKIEIRWSDLAWTPSMWIYVYTVLKNLFLISQERNHERYLQKIRLS